LRFSRRNLTADCKGIPTRSDVLRVTHHVAEERRPTVPSPELAAPHAFKDNRPPMSANPSPNLSPRTAVLLHRGGAFVRGTEAILIRSAKALAAAGYRLVICRRNACIDGPLASIEPRPEFVDFQFPELMISGIRETSLPIGS
jgi:hypothetical protein